MSRAAVENIVRRIPEGRVLPLGALRAALARARPGAALSADAYARLAAEPPEPGARPAPYWRVVLDDGTLLDRLPGGAAAQARALEREGVHVLHLGKRHTLGDVDHYAWTPPPLGRAGR